MVTKKERHNMETQSRSMWFAVNHVASVLAKINEELRIKELK